MTEADLEAIAAREAAATEGPWFGSSGGMAVYGATVGDLVAEFRRRADATFTRHARTDVPLLLAEVARLRAALGEAEGRHRDLVSRLGFGDNVTEPMADNDIIVEWVDALARDANEWGESQAWRIDCALAGHPDDEDCWEHDPARQRDTAEAQVAAVRALADEERLVSTSELRAALAASTAEGGES